MKTDEELLELAAKAVGLHFCDGLVKYDRGELFGGESAVATWNPLEDDGDALRLAVKLGFGISIPLKAKRTDVVSFDCFLVNAIESHGDPLAATRRAIVRAAASIGEKL